MNGLEISPFIAALPKVELHIHIEGTLRPALRWKLAQRNAIALPYATYEDLLASYHVLLNHRPEINGRVPGVPTFLEAFAAGCEVLRTEEDFYEMAMDYFQRCAEMKVRYVEPFFELQGHVSRGVAAEHVMNGFLRAQRDGKERFGVRSNWIFCFIRDKGVENGLAEYETARPWAAIPGGKGLFHAVGLASNAFKKPPMLFEEGFRRAEADGLRVTMHCDFGQVDTYDHMREAIFEVRGGKGAERIDHGLDAADREDLVAGLKERGIALTLCPHAYHRRTPTDVLFNKIRGLWERGVTFSVGSDDPVYMHDVWVDGNLQKVYTYCGMSKKDMVNIVRNGVDMSWADGDVKAELHRELDAVDTEE
ncbi:adenosine deaminase [Colletotrichum sojae]|uniref:Adenosine deaminase n=1 Tax=Colletotrichum sojae TaxID=2175907 RepID=A0A8H6IWK0_9PEZI|nr:adenosine deaminase [Colletotrichum sojae]